MIHLKNGTVIKYNENFDVFFKDLLETIILESHKSVKKENREASNGDLLNEIFLKEIMDNCIFVTHQLFEIAKTNEDLSRFMVTGFIFNSIIYTIAQTYKSEPSSSDGKKDNIFH